jgi:hypothetical protein
MPLLPQGMTDAARPTLPLCIPLQNDLRALILAATDPVSAKA